MLDDLAAVLEKLPEEDRSLFESYVDGVAISKLAEGAQLSYSAMAQRLHRLKDKLRNWLLEIKE
jgi:DNA-directed RNA polymerase specialized sigma24 family protein